ncbi:uncharacterized protein LOC110441318 [Mizuhopecten yessoensis]|uniref:Uncharacterized protein n=1 Tax=Mizuhopecten yessoensis TaxID=6573 RepID=A0A210PJN4_MIZYE|nr:uncharacterized protein LOC110441318 [Mizuhopecten yessoensis]OWF36683.1 hypothetical protein KP79_PYT20714 [Mizuhopecten yessoensis]
MPTSTLAEDCGSKELNLQAGSQKKTSIQEKNFKKLQVSLKNTNDLDNGCMSPVVDSAHVLLKPAENGQMFVGHFEYEHPQKHGQRPNEHMNEYAASYVPSQGGNKMDSYVDLSQCEKENQRNMQYGHQQVNYAEHPNVQTVTGQERYGHNNIQTRSHNNNQCPVSIETRAPQNHKQHVCRKSSKRCCSPLTCFIVAILVIQVIWMGLFAWLLLDKMNLSDRNEEHAGHVPNKDHKSHHIDDFNEITRPPVKYQDTLHYPTPAPPRTKGPIPEVPTLGIKMEIDPSFLSSQGNTVMWTYPDERHLTGIEYHNGYFRVNVTGFYFVQSTLSLDHRPITDNESGTIRFIHCIKVDGRPKMDVCENKELSPIKSGGSTVQDPMMYLESGSSVYVSISHMTKIYDSVTENKFVMFLQRIS